MSEKKHLFRSALGIDHWILQEGNESRFLATQDTTDILDRNRAMATHNDGYNADRTMRRVASVPYIVGLKWLNEEGWWFMDPEHADKLARKLNDPDWRHLRTADGQLGISNGEFR